MSHSTAPVTADLDKIPGPWDAQIRQFLRQDARQFPAPGGVVFVGSSSIGLWQDAQQDFPFINLIRRGFGGSIIEQSTMYAKYIVLPYAPRLVVMYAGDNDIAAGKTPEEVQTDFREFVRTVHAEQPDTDIAFVSIKLSPSRWNLRDKIRRANELIQRDCAATPKLHFIDLTQTLLGENGEPRDDLFSDGLHPNREGYKAWTKVLGPALRELLSIPG